MEMHFATVWESIADRLPDLAAITHGDTTRTWRDYDDRAARIASALDGAGIGLDAKVALYMYNGNEYMEAQYATFKVRGVPINVNYRYLDDELHYLLDNSDSKVLVYHASLGDRVARVVDRLPGLTLLIEVADTVVEPDGDIHRADPVVPGAQRYEDVVAAHEPMPRIERSADDIYMLYTGGTTGMPKGVMYTTGGMTHGLMVSGFPFLGVGAPSDASEVAEIVATAADAGNRIVSATCAPLMHGTGLWIGCFIAHLGGGHVITMTNRSLDAHEVLAAIERHAVTSVTIVGDSFAKPLVRALDEGRPDGTRYDMSSLKVISSSGVMWTTEVKQQLLERIEQVILVDAMSSTEGSMGSQVSMKGMTGDTARFQQAPTTKVFTDDGREVAPGSDEVGMVAAGGNVPLGYFKDEAKSAATFRVIDGVRYSFPGDYAKIAADGSLILLGRGSQVINTGGEKVFPEEVEEAVKRVAGVRDCLVVGIDDDKFGQAVTAVVSLVEPGGNVDGAAVIESVKRELAGYKAPKSVVFVDDVPRAPNGKADYPKARELATRS